MRSDGEPSKTSTGIIDGFSAMAQDNGVGYEMWYFAW